MYSVFDRDAGRLLGFGLELSPEFDTPEGTKVLTVELTRPDGSMVSRDYSIELDADEPYGPDCAPCWRSNPAETWKLPLGA